MAALTLLRSVMTSMADESINIVTSQIQGTCNFRTLDELQANQAAWAAERAESLQAYFRRTKPDAVVDGSWPVRVAA